MYILEASANATGDWYRVEIGGDYILSTRDGDSLGQLLAFKAARRSKSVLFSAFWHGGWRMAERIKPPTAGESEEILREFAQRHQRGSGLGWYLTLLDSWRSQYRATRAEYDETPLAEVYACYTAMLARNNQHRGPDYDAMELIDHLEGEE
jgi:hypothetical protein